MTDGAEIQRYRKNLQDELDGAALYEAIAAAEGDPNRKDLFMQLSQAEADHAKVWREKLEAAGVTESRYGPSLRTRLLVSLARWFGPRFVLPTVAAAEFADRNKYAGQSDAATLSSEERGHAAVVQAAVGARSRGMEGSQIAKAERWHRGGSGNELRAAVLGANDGLVSNFCLVMAVAGAGAPNATILLTGLAGLVAGACSMALGEWLSVANASELARTQIDKEREELEHTPEAEKKELALIFQAKGLDRPEAQRVADQIMRDKTVALDTLVREELGIDPAELGGNPWSAAGFSFVLFALGALFPVLPFLLLDGVSAIFASIGLSGVALGAIGFVSSLFSGRDPWFSTARQILFGGIAAAITYGAGALLGVSLA